MMTNIYIEMCSTGYMQPPITDATKRAVIEEHLRGKNRDAIASDLHLGTGTVSKIIKEWKIGLDFPNADELRELVVGLRKLGISASRYAEGARIASYLVKLGANDEEFPQLVSGIYDSCKKMDLQPDKVVYLLKLATRYSTVCSSGTVSRVYRTTEESDTEVKRGDRKPTTKDTEPKK